jgi:hypothetical protein
MLFVPAPAIGKSVRVREVRSDREPRRPNALALAQAPGRAGVEPATGAGRVRVKSLNRPLERHERRQFDVPYNQKE